MGARVQLHERACSRSIFGTAALIHSDTILHACMHACMHAWALMHHGRRRSDQVKKQGGHENSNTHAQVSSQDEVTTQKMHVACRARLRV